METNILKLENQKTILVIVCCVLMSALSLLSVAYLHAKQEIETQESRIENLILSNQSYKSLLLTPNN